MNKASRTDANLGGEMDNVHYIFGMLTELGELADIFKKNIAYKKTIDWVNAKEELGDFCWYLANFCKKNDLDLEEILDTNIAKLEARYPEKFTEEKAINRNLDAERKILEN
jgi:NTP pyrophosphatase (non-canonical NTP hydrolase)